MADLYERLGNERPARTARLRNGSREAAADEWKPGREADFGKSRHPIPSSQLLGGFSESRDKPSVGFNHRPADLPAEGVHPGSERALGLHRLAEWMLSQDRSGAERLDTGLFPPELSLGDDLRHQTGHLGLVLFLREVSPAGEWVELEDLRHGVLARAETLAAVAGGEFLCAIEPGSLQGLAGQQSVDAMDAGPILRSCYQVLLAAVGEDVQEPLHLCRLLGADGDRLIAPCEHFVAPAGQSADLASQLREEVAHEAGKLLAIGGPSQDMQVVGQEDESRELDAVAALGPCQGSQDDLVEQKAGPEQEAALDRAAGDVEESAPFGSMTESASHSGARAESRTLPGWVRRAKPLRTDYFGEDGLAAPSRDRVKRFGARNAIVGVSCRPARLCRHAKDLDSGLIFGMSPDLGAGRIFNVAPFLAPLGCLEEAESD